MSRNQLEENVEIGQEKNDENLSKLFCKTFMFIQKWLTYLLVAQVM